MREVLIEFALAVVVVAIIAPGVIWWLENIASFVWGPLP
jgi:hypothetical protein